MSGSYEEVESTVIYPDGTVFQSTDGKAVEEKAREALALYEAERES